MAAHVVVADGERDGQGAHADQAARRIAWAREETGDEQQCEGGRRRQRRVQERGQRRMQRGGEQEAARGREATPRQQAQRFLRVTARPAPSR